MLKLNETFAVPDPDHAWTVINDLNHARAVRAGSEREDDRRTPGGEGNVLTDLVRSSR